MIVELIEIEAFVSIADEGGFTRAAQVLHLSQPAVSRRIELLEQELGVPLFERFRGGSRLTGAGEAFLPHARRALAAVQDGSAAVAASETGEEGSVSLALVGTLASTGFTSRLRTFRESHPGVRIALRTARSDEVSRLVHQGEVSLGLRYFPDPSPGIVSKTIGMEELVVVSAGHSRYVPDDVAPLSDLSGTPWVGFTSNSGSSGEQFARSLERLLISAGLDAAEVVAVDSLTAQKRLIEADFGLGLLPVSSVDEEIRIGSLRVIPIQNLEATIPVVVIYRKEGYLGPAARMLLSVLETDSALLR